MVSLVHNIVFCPFKEVDTSVCVPTCMALCCTTFKSPRNLMNQTLCNKVQQRDTCVIKSPYLMLFQRDNLQILCHLPLHPSSWESNVGASHCP